LNDEKDALKMTEPMKGSTAPGRAWCEHWRAWRQSVRASRWRLTQADGRSRRWSEGKALGRRRAQ